mgnify:CR=1 FL=1
MTSVRWGERVLKPPIGSLLEPVKNFKNSGLSYAAISVMYLMKFKY